MGLILACPDWEDRIIKGKSLIPAAAHGINPALTQRAIKVFNLLTLADVPNHPPLGVAAGDWFRELVGVFLGSLDPITGVRLIREAFCLVPKKNSKTSYGAGLMMTALLMNTRPRAEFLLIGPTQAISDLAYDQASGMIENDKVLRERFHIQDHTKTITDLRYKAELKIKTFSADVLTGVKPVGAMVDELHEISKSPRASKIIGQLRGGILPNPEGFLFFITTQSDETPSGAFKAELKMARAVRDGKSQGSMLPMLYEFPQRLQKDRLFWNDPKNWHMVLPNLGRPITIQRLVEDFNDANTKGEEEVRRWCSQHLNIEIGLGLHSDRWVGADYWEQCADPTLTLESLLDRCEMVVVGIDGGGLDDLLGLVILGREKVTRKWLLWCQGWAHTIVLERRKEIAEKLQGFADEGQLKLMDDMGDGPEALDMSEVGDLVLRLELAGMLPPPDKIAVGVDQAGVGDIIAALAVRNIDPKRIGGVPQGWKLQNAIKMTERRLKSGRIVHNGSELMAWNVGNAKVEPRGNAIMITKQAAGFAKIDLLMALFDAVVAMLQNPEPMQSVYETMAANAERAAKEKEAKKDDPDPNFIDYVALNDVHHPQFEEMKKRFLKKQEQAEGKDDEDELY